MQKLPKELYRPISNLSFLSKVLEKVVANRLHEHIYNYHLSNDLQSAYKRFHSTETALLKIHNDIVDNMDNGKVTALTLLDLSAVLDTIDHLILLTRFNKICHPSQRPRWQVDKEAIGLSRVQQCLSTYNPPS